MHYELAKRAPVALVPRSSVLDLNANAVTFTRYEYNTPQKRLTMAAIDLQPAVKESQ